MCPLDEVGQSRGGTKNPSVEVAVETADMQLCFQN